MSLPREPSQTSTAAPPMDDAEQQMRRALGLYGDAPRPRPEAERGEQAPRQGGGFTQGAHRRRFVQDGEVPVTVVRRGEPDPGHGGGQSAPTSSRLQRVEAALTAETAAREKAERALHEAQTAVQALQTKMGHNDLAKNEAVAASKRHLDEIVTLKEELAAAGERVREADTRAHDAEEELRALRAEVGEERRARRLAERLLRETTEETAPSLFTESELPVEPARRETVPARRGRPAAVRTEPEEEAEPVKWWLLPAKPAARGR